MSCARWLWRFFWRFFPLLRHYSRVKFSCRPVDANYFVWKINELIFPTKRPRPVHSKLMWWITLGDGLASFGCSQGYRITWATTMRVESEVAAQQCHTRTTSHLSNHSFTFFGCDITPNQVGEIRIFSRLSELGYRPNNMNKNVIGEMDMMMVLIIT